ncbi:hypothetical protein ETB97_001305 [Aspergillus alliaceus]|uniref:xyloglucan-specific endo-beta-1,4-glucanase n=1 Tax=Petromyces alliaceus TaxID=209559 RepID=A0A8H6A4T5_PETAA|nr:hypothetical protein ETB97_001305 [Aspergillus burnettii]
MLHFPRALAALSFSVSALALPVLFSRAQAASKHCGDYDYVVLQDTPWIVYNMLYNANQIVGSQCTNYDQVITSTSGTKEVVWNSVTEIEYVESTWTRTNTTAYKGNVCFDFMTSDVKGDSTSSSSRELMLWLHYEGGQLPIGWANGAVATIDDLFDTSWKLYEDVNEDTGITVSTLIPETQFDGTFTGDLKDWLLALSKLGRFTESTYVNVGNAGTEFFYGNSIMNATLGLQINLGGGTNTRFAS